jgi:hypothetical protein
MVSVQEIEAPVWLPQGALITGWGDPGCGWSLLTVWHVLEKKTLPTDHDCKLDDTAGLHQRACSVIA